MVRAISGSYFDGRPVGFGAVEAFAGGVAPLAFGLAFAGLVAFVGAFVAVSGMTLIPSVNAMTLVYSIRFHFASVSCW